MDESQTDRMTGAFVDASAALLGLEIRPEWRDEVVANAEAIAAAADLVGAFPLDDDVEAAPVFSA